MYQTLVLSVLLHAADTWTLLAADVRTLDAFHQRYLSRLFGIRWPIDSETTKYCNGPSFPFAIHPTRFSCWACGSAWRRYACKQGSSIPCQCITSFSRPPDRTWRRPPGRPWNKCLDQLPNDSAHSVGDLWRRAVAVDTAGPSRRCITVSTAPAGYATVMMMMIMMIKSWTETERSTMLQVVKSNAKATERGKFLWPCYTDEMIINI